MDDRISVTLTGPAKIEGKREPEGKTVLVTTAMALQLAASGVISPVAISKTDTLSADFDAAVRATVADREANWATAMDHFETMAQDAADARVKAVEAERDAALGRIATLEAALAAATAAPPAEPTGQKTPEKKARS